MFLYTFKSQVTGVLVKHKDIVDQIGEPYYLVENNGADPYKESTNQKMKPYHLEF